MQKKYFWVPVAVLFVLTVLLLFFVNAIKNPTPQPQNASAKEFPAIPVYPGSLLISMSKDPREAVLFKGTWETAETIPVVSGWYLTKMGEDGWLTEYPPSDPNNNDIQYIQFSNLDYFLNISLIRRGQDAKTTITAEFIDNPRNIEVKKMIESGAPPEDK